MARISTVYEPRKNGTKVDTEAVTLISENHITDELFEEVSKEYNAVELV